MVRNRNRKQEIRSVQESSGETYMAAAAVVDQGNAQMAIRGGSSGAGNNTWPAAEFGTGEMERMARAFQAEVELDQMRARHGQDELRVYPHMLFTGPRDGRQLFIAQRFAGILAAAGVSRQDKVVAVSGSELPSEAGYAELEMGRAVQDALGGILFIDEAHLLPVWTVNRLLHAIEDNRGDLVVVAAGSEGEIEDFLDKNLGLIGRFSNRYTFS